MTTAESASVTTLPAEVAAELGPIIEHLNDHHDDAILFMGRHATARPQARAVAIGAVGAAGVTLEVEVPDVGVVHERVDFRAPVESLEGLQAELFELLRSARAADVSAPLTSIERELADAAERPTFTTAVTGVRDLSPNLREVRLGTGLEAFDSLGGDQFVTVAVPQDPDTGLPDGFVVQDLTSRDRPDRPHAATYTVRSHDESSHELVLWMVLHDHDGPVAAWARQATVGDRLALGGPRRTWHPPADLDHLVLFGDETALPAIAAILDEVGDLPTAVVVETNDAEHVIDLTLPPGSSVQWVFRDGEPGSGDALATAVSQLDDALERPDGLGVFGAGEVAQVRPIRRHLRHERGLPADRVDVSGYWRRGTHS